MKYRIEKITYPDGLILFFPQYRYEFWPFYYYFTEVEHFVNGYKQESPAFSFGSEEAAMDFLSKKIKKNKKTVKDYIYVWPL